MNPIVYIWYVTPRDRDPQVENHCNKGIFFNVFFKNKKQQTCHTPLIPAHGRQTKVDLCEFEASLVYRMSSRTDSKATQRNPVLNNNQTKTPNQKNPLLNFSVAEDYTENLLHLHDAEIVRLRNHYEVHKELFEGVQKWEESWKFFLEFEVTSLVLL